MNVAIAASQMQAKLPARVKVDKITYLLAYRRVQIVILFVGKEHMFHLINNGQTSQKSSASFQPFNSIAENLRWHAPKSWQLEIHFRDAPYGSVAHSKRFGNMTAQWRDWNFYSYLAGPLESRSCRRHQQCSAQFELILAVRFQNEWRVTADPVLVMWRQIVFSVQTPLLCRIPWSDALSTKSLFVQFEYASCLRTIDILPIPNIIQITTNSCKNGYSHFRKRARSLACLVV